MECNLETIILTREVGGTSYRVVSSTRDKGRIELVVQEFVDYAQPSGKWEGRAQALMPEGWKPTTFAGVRIAEALLSTVAPVDLDTVPVGQVLGLVTSVASDIIRDGARLKSELEAHKEKSRDASQELTKLRQTVGAQMDALISAFIAYELTNLGHNFDPDPKLVARGLIETLRKWVDGLAEKGAKAPPVQPLVDLIGSVAGRWGV